MSEIKAWQLVPAEDSEGGISSRPLLGLFIAVSSCHLLSMSYRYIQISPSSKDTICIVLGTHPTPV